MAAEPHTEKAFYHFNFLKDIKVGGIYLNSIQHYLRSYPFIRSDHYHDFYSILLFTDGNGCIIVNNISVPVQPGTICLIAPSQYHSFENLENSNGRIFHFCQDFYVEEFSYIRLLDLFYCSPLTDGERDKPVINLPDGDFRLIEDSFNSISREYESPVKSHRTAGIIRSHLNIMMLRLGELHESGSVNYPGSDTRLIHELSHLLDAFYSREHHTGFYADKLNISEKHLNDLCHRHFNTGLKKILNDRLMQEARKLLLSSEFSISEIAYKLNFEDNSYFNKVFRKMTGITPGRFREVHRKFLP